MDVMILTVSRESTFVSLLSGEEQEQDLQVSPFFVSITIHPLTISNSIRKMRIFILCLICYTQLINGFGIAEMVSNYAKVARNKDTKPEIIR